MSVEMWQRAREIFELALETERTERQQFIARQVGGDQQLADAVQMLLDGHQARGGLDSLLAEEGAVAGLRREAEERMLRSDDGPADAATLTSDEQARLEELVARVCGGDAERAAQIRGLLEKRTASLGAPLPTAGDTIGPYRIVEQIGRGGMGVVFLAEREDIGKRVALKVVTGFVSPERMARARAEQRILARLEHPNIAQLFDAGRTEGGAPYFAMEYVEGAPLDRAARQLGFETRDRVRTMIAVCRAVHFAHQRAVVHRDLKPSNIFVSTEAKVKLLDFGIAKLLDEREDDPRLTRTGMRLLTPAYASPEQVRGELVTTASDVYSLGVVLYELLSERSPYVGVDTPADLEAAVLGKQPVAPSQAASRIETRPAVLEGTPASDSAKRPSIDADLDAIALKALRKEPEERYASAEAFARDLERSLDGEPVAARAGSTAYRLRRFIRRHRTAAAVTVAFIGLLIAWGASALVQAQRVVEQRDAARLQAEKAENINDFVLDLFETSDPAIARGEIPDARELLARGAERVDRELSDQPALRVSLKVTLGRVYRNLGLHEEAEALLSGALEDIEQLPDDEREDELDLHILLADVALHRVDVERADEMLRRTVALSIERHGARSPEAAMAHGRQGKGFLRTGRSAEAEAAFLRSAELLEELEPEPSENWAEHYRLRGEAILQQDRTEEGLAHLRRADEIYQRLDGDRAEPRAEVLELIGNTILKEGDVAAARTTLQEALALARQLSVAKPHLELGSTLASLGTLEAAHGDPQTAESLLRESAGAVATVWGERHPKHGMALLKLARFHAGHGDPEAEAGFRRSLDILSQRLPDDHPHMAAIRYRLADFLLAQGRAAEAETLARRVAEIRSQNYGSDDKRTGDAIRLAERAAAQAASQPPNLNRSTP